MTAAPMRVELTGFDLSLEQVAAVARGAATVSLAPAGVERVARSRSLLEAAVADAVSGVADEIYGVTTGFGNFKNRRIPPEDHARHQLNLIRSHCSGAGATTDPDDPGNCFRAEIVRTILLLRINGFLRGHSGLRLELVQRLLSFLEHDLLPEVPVRGSVGASGDLCPLAHLALGVIGEGRARQGDGSFVPTAELLAGAGLSPRFSLAAKEGLALINGTTVTTAVAAIGLLRAEALAESADACAALSLEAMCGRLRALDPRVHQARPHPGQSRAAAAMRAHLAGSGLVNLSTDRQDPYSLRCAPQVHGASHGALAHCREVIAVELNSVSDNPLLFEDSAGVEPVDAQTTVPERGPAYSAGNFHAQPIALVADYMAIAVAELASISERRAQLLLDGGHNRGLPPNLAVLPGLNSGLLLTQYLAAASVSENKVLAHPASVDSIPTASNAEDHVSMGTHAARKALSVCENTEIVLAVELLVGAQALDWRLSALAATPDARPPVVADNTVTIEPGQRLDALGAGTRRAYLAVRAAASFVGEDRVLAGDIASVRRLLSSGEFLTRLRGGD